ncbi:alkaline phosphatase PhoX [Flavobacterium urocaniciphilum]|uniref:Secretion system C-terminal sorting domain-containing protein n=1 Tax=Flavobacterium urocaniciphilum TaxID=1299341 RepID=A0A1H9B456_9FLAO|nr:alkaline phosphatase PhoX [Flavobacterium urocaniciphilum]SEP83635.1 hypothetical protein SAMN05444005_102488 [Flavobacterium urocaniciphilum]
MKKGLLLSTFLISLLGFSKNERKLNYENTSVPPTVLIEKGSTWKFLDNGSDQGTTWKDNSFDNSSWTSNIAPFGYGDPCKTTVSFGPSSTNKYTTTYFSKDITITDINTLTNDLEFGIRRDDGFVLYVNGVEVTRNNMPAGAIAYNTFASSAIGTADEKRYQTFFIAKSYFTSGVNRISIEVHQSDLTSSDLGFDLYLKEKDPDYVCEDGHIGCFTSINPTTQTNVLIMPTEQRFQMLFKEGSTYMDGSGLVPGTHDFTGYIPSLGADASKLGHLSVNHENNPGGVSIVNINLNSNVTNPLWDVTNTRKVDFYNSNLVTTIRNCSGGVTPWRTIVTAEENTTAGDANGDGYQDVGWLVEIDPTTASVVDYENNGVKDKLFALGRMNHENIVVSNDGTVAYYGEDGGTHCVYKFVPTVANNLSAGNVYVLKLDTALSDDEPSSATATWVLVPNTTQADRNNLAANAGALGGTNFNGVEDCEIGPDGMIYFASKGKNRVYRFKDNGTTISNFETFVGGMTYPIQTSTGIVNEAWLDGNDNLAFDDKGNLWVVQDGGRNYIWVVRPNHRQTAPQVLIHSSAPAGSEPTGLTFTPDFKYGFFSVQHPDNTNIAQTDATGLNVQFDKSAALVFSHRDFLGQQPLSSDSFANNNSVKIYPNPTNGLVTLDFNAISGSDVQINVYDFVGRKLIEKKANTSVSKTLEIDLSNFNGSNVYFFEIISENQKETIKVVKSN